MEKQSERYILALKYGVLTSVYDPLIRLALRESTFKRALVRQAELIQGLRVLDLGCGTGTLTLMIKAEHPNIDVVGLDGDENILRIATAKTNMAGFTITYNHAMSFEMPYPNSSFDRVLSSLFFHHLTTENKLRTIKEVMRVLRTGGELHVADWGKPQNTLMRSVFFLVQLLDGFETTADSVQGTLPNLFRECGFQDVMETRHFNTVLGTLCLYKTRKP